FLRPGQRRRSPGDEPLYHLWVSSVSRRTLRRVEHTEPTRGARTDIEEAAAGAKRRLGALDDARDRLALATDRGGNRLVLGVDQIDDLERRGEIDVRGARIPALGQPRVDERHVAANLRRIVRGSQQFDRRRTQQIQQRERRTRRSRCCRSRCRCYALTDTGAVSLITIDPPDAMQPE